MDGCTGFTQRQVSFDMYCHFVCDAVVPVRPQLVPVPVHVVWCDVPITK